MSAKNKLGNNIRPCPRCNDLKVRRKIIEAPFVIVKCHSCGLVYLGNPPDSDRLYDDYYGDDPKSADYHNDSPDTSLRELFAINQQRIDLMKKFMPAGNLLDIGCGRGFFLKTAYDHGYGVSGIDVSEKAIDYARREFHVDAESIPVENLSGRRFDLITLWHVLEHFSDPFIVLRQIHELLADGGICVIEVPNLHSLKFMLARKKWQGGNHPLYHRIFFTASTLRKSILAAGFSKIQRVKLSYHIPGKRDLLRVTKRALNSFAMDSFLDFVAWK